MVDKARRDKNHSYIRAIKKIIMRDILIHDRMNLSRTSFDIPKKSCSPEYLRRLKNEIRDWGFKIQVEEKRYIYYLIVRWDDLILE